MRLIPRDYLKAYQLLLSTSGDEAVAAHSQFPAFTAIPAFSAFIRRRGRRCRRPVRRSLGEGGLWQCRRFYYQRVICPKFQTSTPAAYNRLINKQGMRNRVPTN